jgi:hypothetical protein
MPNPKGFVLAKTVGRSSIRTPTVAGMSAALVGQILADQLSKHPALTGGQAEISAPPVMPVAGGYAGAFAQAQSAIGALARRAQHVAPRVGRLALRGMPWVGAALSAYDAWELYQALRGVGAPATTAVPVTAGPMIWPGWRHFMSCSPTGGLLPHLPAVDYWAGTMNLCLTADGGGHEVGWIPGPSATRLDVGYQYPTLPGADPWQYGRFATYESYTLIGTLAQARFNPMPMVSARDCCAPQWQDPMPLPLAAAPALPVPQPYDRSVRSAVRTMQHYMLEGSRQYDGKVGSAVNGTPSNRWNATRVPAMVTSMHGLLSSRPQVRYGTHTLARPMPRTMEKKFRLPSISDVRPAIEVYGAITEVLDFEQVAFKSLPNKIQRQYQKQWHGMDPITRAQILWDNRLLVDWKKFAWGFVRNQAEDAMIGAENQVKVSIMRDGGVPFGPGVFPREIFPG